MMFLSDKCQTGINTLALAMSENFFFLVSKGLL